jgi:hypothetical protein
MVGDWDMSYAATCLAGASQLATYHGGSGHFKIGKMFFLEPWDGMG